MRPRGDIMLKQNMHIHSNYSWDSKMDIDTIAKILVENDIRYGALTDHVEFNREPLPYVITKLKMRNVDIDRINQEYQGKLTLLKAVEISEPHWYPEQVEELTKQVDLDFIIGSIHSIKKYAESKYERQDIFKNYYKEVLNMIQANQIDVIGHLDYINRYYGKDYSFYGQITEVLNAIKEYNMILEINTSAKRRCSLNLFPDINKICRYKWIQNDVIIGTDAHRENELADNLEQAESITEEFNLKPVIYQKRKRIIL